MTSRTRLRLSLMGKNAAIRTIVAMLVIALVASVAMLWRQLQVQNIYSGQDTPPAPTVTAQHIAALRNLRFAWSALIESGGPVVDPWTPYGSESLGDDLGPILGTSNAVTVARFHREVSSVLAGMLRHCPLPAGRYHLAHLDNRSMENRLRRDLGNLPKARVDAIVGEMPRLSPDSRFNFTHQHQLLLQKLIVKWPAAHLMPSPLSARHPAAMVDFKRPFGQSTAFELDMAAILGKPRPRVDALDPALARLYWEMWPALQAFVEHAPFETCTRKPSIGQAPDRASSQQ